MLCWLWHKIPVFSVFLVSCQKVEGRKKDLMSNLCVFPWCSCWYHHLCLVNFNMLETFLVGHSFDYSLPVVLILEKCKIYRMMWTGAGWKSFQNPVMFLLCQLLFVIFHNCCVFWEDGRRWGLAQCAVFVCVCHTHVFDAEINPGDLGRAYVYPASLFAEGKCFMLKALLSNFTCNEGKNQCL